MIIILMAIGDYSIDSYSINGYCQLFYQWPLLYILLMAIVNYSINGYC
jgi:hypothetical protein